MLMFIGGLAYGVFSVVMFLYTVLLGLCVFAETHGDLPEDDTADAVLWFVGELGIVRVALYVILALLWPALLVVLGILGLLYKKYESRDDMPGKMMQKIDWFLLGFGKFVTRGTE